MGFSVKLYHSFSKRLNSTKQPTDDSKTLTLTCELKAPTNLFMPVMVLDRDTVPAAYHVTDYTYAYVADFKRYYYITNWTWMDGQWGISMECDVLATFKSSVGNTTAYVLRAANDCDPNLIDNKYMTVADPDRSHTMAYDHVSTPWYTNTATTQSNYAAGFYRIGIANDDSGAIGSISYYAFSPAAMRELFDKLYASPSWLGITDTSISTDLQKIMFNPIQYITDVMWIPLGLDTSGLTSTQSISIGWWSLSLTTYSCYKLTSNRLNIGATMQFQNFIHPQQGDSYHDWLSLAPYTRYAVEFQPFGMFELDSSKLYGAYGIELEYYVDVMTGRGLLSVYRTDISGGIVTRSNCVLYTCTAQVGLPISVAQMSVDLSALSSVSTWAGATAIAGLSGDLVEHVSQFGQNLAAGVQNTGAYLREFGKELMSGVSFGGALDALGSNLSNMLTGNATANGTSIGGSLLSSMKEVASDILPAAIAAAGICQQQGCNGGFAMLRRDVRFIVFYQLIVDQDPTHYGRPLCKMRQISGISGGGFILCANEGDLSMTGTEFERQAVAAFMTAGFYYE